jgi:hypothetical protein
MAKQMGVKTYPTLLLKEFSSEKVNVFTGKMKLPELIKFAAPFALPKVSAKAERVLKSQSKSNINSKKIDTGFKVLEKLEDLNQKILESHKSGLVLYLDKD